MAHKEKSKGVSLSTLLMQLRDKTKPLTYIEGGEKQPLNLKIAITTAVLNGADPDPEKPESASYQAKRYVLAMRVQEADIVSFSAEETTLIMTSAGRTWSTMVVGRMYELLDPAALS